MNRVRRITIEWDNACDASRNTAKGCRAKATIEIPNPGDTEDTRTFYVFSTYLITSHADYEDELGRAQTELGQLEDLARYLHRIGIEDRSKMTAALREKETEVGVLIMINEEAATEQPFESRWDTN